MLGGEIHCFEASVNRSVTADLSKPISCFFFLDYGSWVYVGMICIGYKVYLQSAVNTVVDHSSNGIVRPQTGLAAFIRSVSTTSLS